MSFLDKVFYEIGEMTSEEKEKLGIDDSIERWKSSNNEIGVWRSRPYKKCSHCGKYDYYVVRQKNGKFLGIFGDEYVLYYGFCVNCHYKTEEVRIDKESEDNEENEGSTPISKTETLFKDE